jgi:mRNA interferase RelE/StbE
MKYSIHVTPTAQEMLEDIQDRRVREKIVTTIDRLGQDPQKQGKPLIGPLAGFRSLRAVGQRYRIIYAVKEREVIVIIVAVGIRKEGDRGDIYRRLQKLVRLHLL